MATVVTVLRSGGDFLPKHVRAMKRQIAKWAPQADFLCLSDVDIPGVHCIRLKYDWPGWWAKMELFRPDLDGHDFLFTDLDNVILGPIDDFFNPSEWPVLQFGGWTALMWMPSAARREVWNKFISDPAGYMTEFHKLNVPEAKGIANYGDAGLISSVWINELTPTWEGLLPGKVLNIVAIRRWIGRKPEPFKRVPPKDIFPGALGNEYFREIPQDTRVFLCGQPYRPWLLPMFAKSGLWDE